MYKRSIHSDKTVETVQGHTVPTVNTILFKAKKHVGYSLFKHLNDMGIKGKMGGTWPASSLLRTCQYHFHKSRNMLQPFSSRIKTHITLQFYGESEAPLSVSLIGLLRNQNKCGEMFVRKVPVHHSRKTAARDTNEYVFAQLIPYIGNKRKLLDLINQAIELTNVKDGIFVDLFSGSTVVARFAKQLDFRVLSNDWEPYSEQIAIGTVVLNEVPRFAELGGCANAFQILNNATPIEGYVTKHLCPSDDENLNHESDRLFYMRKNGMKIDAMRELISTWMDEEKITSLEFAYIMASFMYSASYVSNTSGVFKGFHRGWGGSNGTAQYRICSDIVLKPSPLYDNGEKNLSTRQDAGKLVHNLADILGGVPDIIYLDPPYNQHPYGSNYHVLNTITLWDEPDFPEKITRGTKSAIRLDWRTERRSAYNSHRKAAQEFQELIDNISAKFILTSYSTEGNIPLETMMEILGSKGSLRIVKREYVRYRVSPTRLSPKPRNVEFVVITDTNGKPESKENLEEIVADLRRIDSEIPENDDALPNGQRTLEMYEGKGQRALKQFDKKEKSNSYKCGKCGEKGHNSRTCQS